MLSAWLLTVALAPAMAAEETYPLSGMPLRSIGPALTSGRVADFAFHPDRREVYYVAMASGDLSRGLDRNALEVMGRVWSVDARPDSRVALSKRQDCTRRMLPKSEKPHGSKVRRQAIRLPRPYFQSLNKCEKLELAPALGASEPEQWKVSRK